MNSLANILPSLKGQDLSLYIHVPFCSSKCDYCSFYSVSFEDEKFLEEKIELWFEEILSELKFFLPALTPKKIATIYFGGGTPSLVSAKYYKKFFSVLKEICKKENIIFSPTEISLEVNPAHLNFNFIDDFSALGINRITLGVQSFDNKKLKWLGRDENKNCSYKKLKRVIKYGIKKNINFGIDLICGLKNQSFFNLKSDLKKAIKCKASHISLYRLIVDNEIKIFSRANSFSAKDQTKFDLSEIKATKFLEKKGFKQYEISNFAKAGFESKHNLVYWNMQNSLGLGKSAVSTLLLNNGKNGALRLTCSGNAKFESEIISKDEFIFENLMMGLRLKKGIDLKFFKERFCSTPDAFYKSQIENFIKKGYLIFNENEFKMSEKGYNFLNEFLISLLE